ncbi:RHS repeat-associated core domain-containing protein, partial [bacterium]|nr:RHS repeat-associated core domain-containing protein [bacterium]
FMTVSGSLFTNATSVTVNNVQAQVYHDYTFSTATGVPLANGLNTFTARAVDAQNFDNALVTTANLPVSVYLSYDQNGNLLTDGLRWFDYDAADRLVRVYQPGAWKAEFTYDGLSRRRVTQDYAWQDGAWILTNETRYVYLGRLVIQERNVGNTPTATYTRGLDLSATWDGAGGIGGLLARTDLNGAAFYHNDGAGNITSLINSQGQIQARYIYDPFGNLVSKRGPLADANLYRFSSKEHHPHSRLYYYGFRFYEPNLQRWINRDPIGFDGGINLYAFVSNDPMAKVDTDGDKDHNIVVKVHISPSWVPPSLIPTDFSGMILPTFQNPIVLRPDGSIDEMHTPGEYLGLESDDEVFSLLLAKPTLKKPCPPKLRPGIQAN